MRCEDLEERLAEFWDGTPSSEVAQHVAQCKVCAHRFRDLQLVRAGFGLLAHEQIPEPSLGFAERLARQLGEMGKRPVLGEFLESVGRRFVYATLALTFLVLLALALPSAGPVRGVSSSDVMMPAQETTLARIDPMSESGQLDILEGTPVGAPALSKGAK